MNLGRVCVYTVLTGGYETLNEQPVAASSSLPFVCLTDDPDLTSTGWQIRVVPPIFGFDRQRSQRDMKIRGHLHMPEFDASLYIDNSVLLREPPERLFEIFDVASGLSVPLHSYRDTVLDEFLAVAEGGYDDQGRIFEQLNHYLIDCPEILDEKPYATMIMLRDHRNPRVRAALENWAAHVFRYSRRDQLSANVAFRQAGLTPQALAIDNYSSPFHSWPHPTERLPRRGPYVASLEPLVARLRRLDGALAAETDRARELEQKLAGETERVAAIAKEGKRYKELLSSEVVVARTAGRAWIFANPNDDRARALAMSKGNVNPAALRMWHALLAERDWDLVVDVGANYGEMLVNGGLPSSARVVAVEPNPNVRRYLKRTLAAYGTTVKVIGSALSDADGQATLVVNCHWSGTTRLADKGAEIAVGAKTVEVRTRTLASLIRRQSRRNRAEVLVKIDVEGHEIAVLRGAEGALDRLGAFVALTELTHLGREARTWLLDRFDVDVLELESGRFARVAPSTVERLTEMLATRRFHLHDVVLRVRSDVSPSRLRPRPLRTRHPRRRSRRRDDPIG